MCVGTAFDCRRDRSMIEDVQVVGMNDCVDGK